MVHCKLMCSESMTVLCMRHYVHLKQDINPIYFEGICQ